jgi:nucleotide-binding universal stress UspA family protein
MIYKYILVPLDGSELAECVLPHVSAIAEKGLTENITLIRVVEEAKIPSVGGDAVISVEEWQKLELERKLEAENYLKYLFDKLKFIGVDVKWVVLPTGGVAEMILQYASENKVDLIVMGTHGRSGISRLLWGSVAYQILRSAYIPVLMVRPKGYGDSVSP